MFFFFKKKMKSLKETADECDTGLQYHLARYTYLFENTMVSDGLVIAPVNEEDGNYTNKILSQSHCLFSPKV
jgi:Rho GTPase-activating protein RGD1